jgi:hypothetical protein
MVNSFEFGQKQNYFEIISEILTLEDSDNSSSNNNDEDETNNTM